MALFVGDDQTEENSGDSGTPHIASSAQYFAIALMASDRGLRAMAFSSLGHNPR